VFNIIRVWRRLVARLNGVQEAAGSTPVTRTKKTAICVLQIAVFLVFSIFTCLSQITIIREIRRRVLFSVHGSLKTKCFPLIIESGAKTPDRAYAVGYMDKYPLLLYNAVI
jgi:hypothetical protein